jgi:hypothetical protein
VPAELIAKPSVSNRIECPFRRADLGVQTLFITVALSAAVCGALLLFARAGRGIDPLTWWGSAMLLGGAGLAFDDFVRQGKGPLHRVQQLRGMTADGSDLDQRQQKRGLPPIDRITVSWFAILKRSWCTLAN